ncbi:MAG: FkbM family methyltransferase [Isosphaerales bacterium]
MARTDQLPVRLKALAFLMRRMPTGVRKFAWWWDRLYQSIGGGGFADNEAIDSLWPSGEHGPVRIGRFGYKVVLDLRAFPERRTYFIGSYIQEDLEYLFPAILRRGDQYLDIGANIGMTTLMASALIGPEGKGFAFEPNPEVFARLKRHLELNGTSNIEAVPFALSNREAEMSLVVPSRFTGLGSLAVNHDGSGRSYKVRTVIGRPYLERLDPSKPTVVKIDVEGHEVKALSGIEEFLDRPDVAILSEVSVPLLRQAGDSAEALFELLTRHGFRPFVFNLQRGRFQTKLMVAGFDSFRNAMPEDWCDFLFAKPDSKLYRERIAPLLALGR